MMGNNWRYDLGSQYSILKKYAWLPVKTNSNKRVWFDEYYIIQTHHDESGRPPVQTLSWQSVLNKNEYLIWLILNPTPKYEPPSGMRKSYYYKRVKGR